MIYFTTFILALFISQIARAVPQACGDAITPESQTPVEQFNLATTVVTYNPKYDYPNASTKSVACWNLFPRHHQFHNFPTFPRIGGASDIGFSPGPNCGKCWRLHNLENGHTIVITAIDHAERGFVLSEAAFKLLDNGHLGPPLLHVQYVNIPEWECGL